MSNSVQNKASIAQTELKSKYKHLFDIVYVSNRVGQILQENYFDDLLKANDEKQTSSHSILCVETVKYMVTLNNKEKTLYNDKIMEFATGTNPNEISNADAESTGTSDKKQRYHALNAPYPINRRSRDGNDSIVTPDVLFFST